MDNPKDFEDIECEDIKQYCPWQLSQCEINGLCEGRFCTEAYERYLESFYFKSGGE